MMLYVCGKTMPVLCFAMLLCLSVWCSWLDIKHQTIDIAYLWLMGAISLLYNLSHRHVMYVLITTGISFTVACTLKYILKQEALGKADVIIIALSGCWMTHWQQLPIFFVLSGAFGLLTSMIYKTRRFPFCPALCAALWITLAGSIHL